MSRWAGADKLPGMEFAPDHESVELLVRFAPHSGAPAGSVRDQCGAERPFSGWLGLLRLLEEHCPTTPKEAS